MNKEQYKLYLQTPHWRSFRERVLLRSVVAGKYKCESCGDLFRRVEMEIHHKHYKTIGRESPTDVAVLCGECHSRTHGKDKHANPCEIPNRNYVKKDTVYAELMASAYESLRPIHKRMIDGVIK